VRSTVTRSITFFIAGRISSIFCNKELFNESKRACIEDSGMFAFRPSPIYERKSRTEFDAIDPGAAHASISPRARDPKSDKEEFIEPMVRYPNPSTEAKVDREIAYLRANSMAAEMDRTAAFTSRRGIGEAETPRTMNLFANSRASPFREIKLL